jgi:hypothetical protein
MDIDMSNEKHVTDGKLTVNFDGKVKERSYFFKLGQNLRTIFLKLKTQ